MTQNEEIILIDGNSLINRAFYGVPPLTTKAGEPAGAVYGFTNMLIKLIESHSPSYIAVAFDMKAKTFRHLAYDGYKANRHEMPAELASQIPLLKELLSKMGIRIIEKEGIEADDIIGTMAKSCNVKTYIVTGDRDSFQLIDDRVTVLFTKKGISEVDEVTPLKLKEDMHLTPAQIIDYKALAGDSSDNIPGVNGVGEKTAIKLLEDYGSLSSVYEHLGEIGGALNAKLKNGRAQAELSQFLATIKTDCEIDTSLEKCRYKYPFGGGVFDFFVRLEFKNILKRDIFERGVKEEKTISLEPVLINITSLDQLSVALKGIKEFALVLGETADALMAVSDKLQYVIKVSDGFFEEGLAFDEIVYGLKGALESSDVKKYVYDKKKYIKLFSAYSIKLNSCDDVALMDYLTERDFKYSDAKTLSVSYGAGELSAAAAVFAEAKRARQQLDKLGMTKLYEEVELPLTEVLASMEKAGFAIDTKRLAELEEKYGAEEREIIKRIHILAGKAFNVNSPKQLGEVLFLDLGLRNPNRGSANSTSADILEKIRFTHPIVDEILRYRFISKLKSTYIEGLEKLVDSHGKIHTEFNQMLTVTGRLSSSKPNLQNIPVREEEGRTLRELFIPSPGNVLVSADYSQIELRVMAHLSNDANLIAAYKSGADIHSSVASELFGEPFPSAEQRRIAKTVNFGIIYGMSAFGLSEELKIPPLVAKDYIERYFQRYPCVKKYTEMAVEDAKVRGYGESILGRRRVISELMSPNRNERAFGERAAMNMPVQASAADIIKIAMNRVHARLKNMKSKLILQIHDELVIDAAPDEAEEVKSILKTEMEGAIELSVPLVAEVKSGMNLKECK
ncbi:MAG: DNA polymerase I [Clostridia bacterium]|nr:DNA polymerase I [Clostridia bacterium]